MEAMLVQRLETVVARLEALSCGRSQTYSAPDGSEAISDASISAYDDFVANSVDRLSAVAQKIGGQVLEATNVVEEAFAIQKDLLIKMKQIQRPNASSLNAFLNPLNEVLAKASALTEGRRTESFNHLKATGDSLTALAWLAYLGKESGMSLPAAHIEESWQIAEFYTNKILVEHKNKDPNHVEWAKTLKAIYLPGLRNYVKNFYPLGPVWKSNCGMVNVAPATSKASELKTPPPAPVIPPSPPFPSTDVHTAAFHPKEGLTSVFQEINSGKPVTAGLRKVTDDMKTKNFADRTGMVKKEVHKATPVFSKIGPPKLELQMGRKWAVENQIGRKDLVIDKCNPKQSVYVFGCKDSNLHIRGKVNFITVDKCSKMGILFMDVVAACEIVNCDSVEVQCQGSAPTISVDNTTGCHLYLGEDSLGSSITTAKSSEINVLVPGAGSSGDWVEHALPQQFVHAFKDGQLITSPLSHSGG